MHYVNRRAEPKGLQSYRDRYTPGWVNHYARENGAKPSDSHWRKFHGLIEKNFFGLCGYCETACRGEVDHFRPKNRFPKLVYEWSNWVFSCHDCNHSKGRKWPDGGYIDPCARIRSSRPEKFFEFDLISCEIIPRNGLTPRHQQKAKKMIDDLHLNDFHHLKARLQWITVVSQVLNNEDKGDPDHENFIQLVSSRDRQFSSVTRVLLADLGYSVYTP